MELHQAYEVKEVYSPEAANAAIQKGGWTLLAVSPATHMEAPGQRICVCYVLGKTKPPAEGKYVDGNWVPDQA